MSILETSREMHRLSGGAWDKLSDQEIAEILDRDLIGAPEPHPAVDILRRLVEWSNESRTDHYSKLRSIVSDARRLLEGSADEDQAEEAQP